MLQKAFLSTRVVHGHLVLDKRFEMKKRAGDGPVQRGRRDFVLASKVGSRDGQYSKNAEGGGAVPD